LLSRCGLLGDFLAALQLGIPLIEGPHPDLAVELLLDLRLAAGVDHHFGGALYHWLNYTASSSCKRPISTVARYALVTSFISASYSPASRPVLAPRLRAS